MSKPLKITMWSLLGLIGLLVLVSPLGPVLIVLGLVLSPFIVLYLKRRYFKSEEFIALRDEAASFVKEHNDIVEYVEEIRGSGAFAIGSSNTGQHSHVASFQNNSSWNYRRDRNRATYSTNVHNASLQVVRNASVEPIKYFMKYFMGKTDLDALKDVQRVAEDITRLQEAVENLESREAEIRTRVNPPWYIRKFFMRQFWEMLGVHISPITVPLQEYVFQYTSAGGNSGQVTRIKMTVPTLETLAEAITEKIRWTNSIAGQRALMTSALRNRIKVRDDFTCLNCKISVAQEPHLLLEIDHIVPVSKGGLSAEENLQTLCWRCNRSKGAKLVG